jgi:hypothetical protein
VQPPAKGGKAAAVKPPPPRPRLPAITPDRACAGRFVGVGNYHVRTLDLCGNALGDAGVFAIAQGLVIDKEAQAAAAAAVPLSARAKAAAAAAAASAPPPEDLLASGALPDGFKPATLRVYLRVNGVLVDTVEELQESFPTGAEASALVL